MKDLFTLSGAKQADPAVGAWFAQQPADLSAIARRWFDQMRRCGPDVLELIHDGCPVACVGDAAFAYVNVFSSHVNVGFFLGAYLDDPADLLSGSGKSMRHIKLRPDSMQDDAAISRLIDDAYANLKSARNMPWPK